MGALGSPDPVDCRSQFSEVDLSGDLGFSVTVCLSSVTSSCVRVQGGQLSASLQAIWIRGDFLDLSVQTPIKQD
jgi:hypothetical protein